MVNVLKQRQGIEKHMTTLIVAVNFDGTVQPLTLVSSQVPAKEFLGSIFNFMLTMSCPFLLPKY
jgi:hypothetical protein